MDASGSLKQLLQFVQGVLYGGDDGDVSQFLLTLQQARPNFVNLLRYKARLSLIT
jgi:hypothetical protein